jgi:hypothetical protein
MKITNTKNYLVLLSRFKMSDEAGTSAEAFAPSAAKAADLVIIYQLYFL